MSYVTTKDILVSSGKDGQISTWNVSLEKLMDFSRIPEQFGMARCILHNASTDRYLMGTSKNSILGYPGDLSSDTTLVLGHFEEMWGVASHSSKPMFASCAHEQQVCVWDSETKSNVWSYYIEEQAQCAEFHPLQHYLLIGM